MVQANPLLQVQDEDAFVKQLLDGLGSFPTYFLQLPEVNRRGVALLEKPRVPALLADRFTAAIATGAVVIDVATSTTSPPGTSQERSRSRCAPSSRPGSDGDFLATAAPPDVFDAVLAGESLGETTTYRFPAAVWRHYERLQRFRAGLLVIGDALCSLNPLNAQGLGVAAMEAAALGRCLGDGRDDLIPRFFRAAAGVMAVPWEMAAGADSPEASGNAVKRLQTTMMKDDEEGDGCRHT